MKTYVHNGETEFFNDHICKDENIYFHGTHADNAITIEREGIKRPIYPKPILDLIEEYKYVTKLLSLSYAIYTFDDTYKGKQDIVFLTKACSAAAKYVRSRGGEMMNTLRISAHNLRLLIDDQDHLRQRIAITKKQIEMTWGEEQNDFINSLSALHNIEKYAPLLDKTETVFEDYPQYFMASSIKGVVYALHADGLELDDQGNQGISIEYVPTENLIAKSTFEIGSIRNHCNVCRVKENARLKKFRDENMT